MSIPKLNFRAKPLKLPPRITFKKKPIEIKVVEPEETKIKSTAEPDRVTTFLNSHYKSLIILFFFILGLVSLYRVATFKKVHTVKKMICSVRNKIASCKGNTLQSGTFVVEVSESCAAAVYEIGGFPFSVAKQNQPNIFKVPVSEFTVKNIVSTCTINAYIDSAPMRIDVPFTWVTTAQHTRFTLKSGSKTLAYDVSASLFDSETNGRWIAYTFDIPDDLLSVSVSGDGSDVIHTYGVYKT